MAEIWKEINGFENDYMVSDLGRVKSLKNGVEYLLKPLIDVWGYYSVGLSKNGVTKRIKVHRLVALHFVDNPRNKDIINHLSGVKTDNRAINLEWCDRSENQIHAYKHNLQIPKSGSSHWNSSINEETVLKIRSLYKQGYTQKELRIKFNLSQPRISKIVNNKRWVNLEERLRQIS